MRITDEVNLMLMKAYQEAKKYNSEYITPEHLVYGATYNERVANAIRECGGDVENLRYNLTTYIKTYVSATTRNEPQESIEFQRVILMANEQVKYSGKDAINIDHILAAIFELEDSYAKYYLEQEGVNKADFLFSLCHGNDLEDYEHSDDEYESEVNDEIHEDYI